MIGNGISIDGMTPAQVVEVLRNRELELDCGMDRFWLDKSCALIKHTAYIALALDSDVPVRDAFIRSEKCRPYSIAALSLILGDERMGLKAIETVGHLANLNDDEADPLKAEMLRKAVKSGTWLVSEYHSIGSEDIKLRFKSCVGILLSGGIDDDTLAAQDIHALTKVGRT